MANILVISNFPNRESALSVANKLIVERLAACVNVLADCTSIYRWQDKVECENEVPIFIKTTDDCYARLEATIRQNHPYEVPEIIAIPIQTGLPAYLRWLGEQIDV